MADNFYNSFFVRGWRPTLGWVVVTAVTMQFALLPLLNTYISSQGNEPLITDTGSLVSLISLVLGSVGFRAYEKTNKGEKDYV